MKSTIDTQAAGKEYQWREDGKDGLRSYSYAKSNTNWSYSEIDDEDEDPYTFSDSSTGQPFARRGNLYNMTAATLGSWLKTGSYKQATDSICPCGWQLPGGQQAASNSPSWDKFLNAYWVNSTAVGHQRMMKAPLQYFPVGIYTTRGYVLNRTTYGYWWSGEVEDEDYSTSLEMYSQTVETAGDSHGSGYALREVVRMLVA